MNSVSTGESSHSINVWSLFIVQHFVETVDLLYRLEKELKLLNTPI